MKLHPDSDPGWGQTFRQIRIWILSIIVFNTNNQIMAVARDPRKPVRSFMLMYDRGVSRRSHHIRNQQSKVNAEDIPTTHSLHYEPTCYDMIHYTLL